MSDNSRNEEPETPPDEAALSARLKRLGERLEQSNTSRSSAGSASRLVADHSGFARGFRLSSELVAGVLVGAGLGWLIDKGLGTLPWGVFVLALLGFAAGVWNVMRQAGVVSGGVPDSTIERRDN
jgi:ATP synthase protein I